MNAGLRSILFSFLAVSLALCAQPSTACGPEFERTIFTGTRSPDAPLEEYLQGRLGIPQPTFARSYLYVAYRYLSGAGLSPDGQKAVLGLLNQRISVFSFMDSEAESDTNQVPKEWAEERAKVDGQVQPPDPVKQSGYLSYNNCLRDSFVNAAAVLKERIERFGATSPEVAQWVQAQDLVFSNCSRSENIPGPPPEGVDPLIARDRAYQIAAAHFYAGRYDKAAELFLGIADDPASPWREIAPYLAGRALLRKALAAVDRDVSGDDAKKQAEAAMREMLARAEEQFLKVLGRPDLAQWHPRAQRMLNLIRFRLHPDERRKELAGALLANPADGALSQDLTDYLWLLDRFSDLHLGEEFAYSDSSTGDRKTSELPAALKDEGDLTDWLFTFQYDAPELLAHALERYRATGSLPWLVASLSKITPEDQGYPALLDSALKVPGDSPGYLCVAYHIARCYLVAGKVDEARAKADELLALPADRLPQSSKNLLLALRTRVARDLDEYLRYAQRVPVRFSYARDYPYAKLEGRADDKSPEGVRLRTLTKGLALFDTDVTLTLNGFLPLHLLAKTALSEALPEHLRLPLARSTWVRAVLLDREETAVELASFLKARDPAMTSQLSVYLNAKTRDAKKSAAVFAILGLPGLRPCVETGLGRLTPLERIDSYRDNWWCSLDCTKSSAEDFPFMKYNYCQEGESLEAHLAELQPGGKMDFPGFLSAADREAAKKERAALAAVGPGPNYLAAYTIAWAKREGKHASVPEALHLAVRTTRYGCTDAETKKLSKGAFDILHKNYPQSPWTKKTPYYY